MQAQAGCTEYNAFVVRADCIVHFRRKYLKGLLSIPCDGRGARRPLGQSFHESVGPAMNLYYPVAQSVGLSAQASASLHVSVKHLSHSGLFQSAQFGM